MLKNQEMSTNSWSLRDDKGVSCRFPMESSSPVQVLEQLDPEDQDGPRMPTHGGLGRKVPAWDIKLEQPQNPNDIQEFANSPLLARQQCLLVYISKNNNPGILSLGKWTYNAASKNLRYLYVYKVNLALRENSVYFSTSPLICFPNDQSWQHWLCLPFSLLFLLAMGANITLLLTICLDNSLHQPMYYLLSLLSLLDMVLCLAVIPKVLDNFWFGNKSIGFSACFLQMFIMNSILTMESCTFMAIAYDRYVAICHPLRYLSIITDQFVARASVFVIARHLSPILSARLRYYAGNTIENYICTNLSVSRLSCDDITFNRLYQFVIGWMLLGSDFILIVISYSFILRVVLRIKAEGAVAKALSTCGSHFILILFFSMVLLVLVITNLARERIPPDVPILLNILHHLVPSTPPPAPPALNSIVYGVKTKEIKQGIQNLQRRL
ncbi:LOW QUALITY PROTEIN: olfactory receptor 56A4-like [Dipodomys merriami]|uniref:LOW QUALITY PROTEIN: olfactory receptor 56A4-like n=1 Tax=Dipodomys merriami TaxID=94247 RepID=UPI003855C371